MRTQGILLVRDANLLQDKLAVDREYRILPSEKISEILLVLLQMSTLGPCERRIIRC